jgi:dynein heavy chain, axonemal
VFDSPLMGFFGKCVAIQDLEDKVLRLLSESKGVILDDEELITALGSAKSVSDATAERVKESEKMQEQLAKMRDSYRAVAARGSVLYFAVAALTQLDSMYQHSLAYFKQLFGQSLRDAPDSGGPLSTRIASLLRHLVRLPSSVDVAIESPGRDS